MPFARYFEDHPELAGEDVDYDEFAVQGLAVQETVEASVHEVLANFENQLRRQQALVDRWRFISPAIVTLEALQDVAGTGASRFRHFLDQVESFHQTWRDTFRPKVLRREPIRAEDLEQLPNFQFVEEPLTAVGTRTGFSLLGLIVPTIGLGYIGRWALARYPIVG